MRPMADEGRKDRGAEEKPMGEKSVDEMNAKNKPRQLIQGLSISLRFAEF